MNIIKKNPQCILEKFGSEGIEVGRAIERVVEPKGREDGKDISENEVEHYEIGRTHLGLKLESKPIYITGKYNKFSRTLP